MRLRLALDPAAVAAEVAGVGQGEEQKRRKQFAPPHPALDRPPPPASPCTPRDSPPSQPVGARLRWPVGRQVGRAWDVAVDSGLVSIAARIVLAGSIIAGPVRRTGSTDVLPRLRLTRVTVQHHVWHAADTGPTIYRVARGRQTASGVPPTHAGSGVHDRPRTTTNAYQTRPARPVGRAGAAGHWVGQLSSSALSTATAASALAAGRIDDDAAPATPCAQLIDAGRASGSSGCQNADGGWGDTDKSLSNIATTMLVRAAFHLAGAAGATRRACSAGPRLHRRPGRPRRPAPPLRPGQDVRRADPDQLRPGRPGAVARGLAAAVRVGLPAARRCCGSCGCRWSATPCPRWWPSARPATSTARRATRSRGWSAGWPSSGVSPCSSGCSRPAAAFWRRRR